MYHSHLHILPSGSSNTKLHDLDLFSWFLCDLEDLSAPIEPSLPSGFYIESLGLLNHIETS